MKLSISTDSLIDYRSGGFTDRDVIRTIKGAGFGIVDYDITLHNFENPEADGAALRAYLDEFGVTAGQAHAPGIDFSNITNRAHWSDAEANFVFCRAAGIDKVVVHPSAIRGNTRGEFFERNAAFYKGLIPVIEKTGVKLLIENIGNYADPYFMWNGADLKEMVDMVGHPLVGACWDTGHGNHFLMEHCEQYPSILTLGDKLWAIHFHDNVGDISDTRRHHRLDMHMLPYMTWAGTLNYDAVIKGLVDSGYRGTFNIEPSACQVRRYIDPLVIDGREIDALRLPPPEIWTIIYKALYDICRYMLETYGAFEE